MRSGRDAFRVGTWRYIDFMSERIAQLELRNDIGRIKRGLDEGRTYVVTRHSEPVAEMVPL